MDPKALEGLSPAEKRALLQKLLAQKAAKPASRPLGPRPGPRDADAPLSFSQERSWLLERLRPMSGDYTIAFALVLRGTLDTVALERTIAELVRRHDVLRTCLPVVDGRPVQRVSPTAAARLEVEDRCGLSEEDQTVAVRLRMDEEAARGFELATGPLARFLLLRYSAEANTLVITLHDTIADGQSLSVLLAELRELYAAFHAGRPSPLPELALQFADFSVWERERATSPQVEEHLTWWRQRLQVLPPRLQLPADARPAASIAPRALVEFALPGALAEELRKLGRQENASLFMVLEAAYHVLISRLSGERDIAVGVATAGRARSELEGLFGRFENLIVLRAEVPGAEGFRAFLRRMRDTVLDTLSHQEVPFSRVVEAVQPTREADQMPIVQVLFGLQPSRAAAYALEGLEVSTVKLDAARTDIELDLHVYEEPDGSLSGVLGYRSDHLRPASAERLVGCYRTLLEGLVAEPERRLEEVSLLSEAERRRLLVEWNDFSEAPPPTCIHEQFAAQAARTPDAVAVVFEDEVLTYAELRWRSGLLARLLRAHGVGPEVRVGVCVERSVEMVVGLLAILEAGGAYVPLDPSYPAERLTLMLEDSGAAVLLTQRHLIGNLGNHHLPTVLADGLELAATSNAPLRPNGVGPANLAYVIYTSGSTGRPKGVMVPHATVANFFTAMDRRLGGSPPGSWLAVTSISFDISVLELLWTLTRGFKVVIQGEEGMTLRTGTGRRRAGKAQSKPLDFSLFYFADDSAQAGGDRYRLLFEGARFADRNGFAAVWTPERHFHAFGGLYPNPSVTSAALAAMTERVSIRAGSVVLPLHHPVRVAEEWALVDNISKGRVGVSFASGWHADDFVFAPENFDKRREVLLEGIDTIRRLWRGESVHYPGGAGNPVDVRLRPQPIQQELPIWLTAAGHPDTFRVAGRLGTNVLTHLLGQSLEELERKLALYREAWKEAGHPGEGHVTLMLHTFLDSDAGRVRERVEGPFRNYLKSSLDLMRGLGRNLGIDIDASSFSPEDLDRLVAHGFERYFETSGLFGTSRTVREKVEHLKELGVNEVGCLIDFGIEPDQVLAGLPHLLQVKERSDKDFRRGSERFSLPAQLRRHAVTHLQCTPSLARALLMDSQAPGALSSLSKLLVGGEALPANLAGPLRELISGELLNMYGPTETTVWSSSHVVGPADGPAVPIGGPITRTQLYILDARLQPVPPGVPGELYIAGDGVVRGYLGRPELTAERFLADPFSGTPGARMYRTGDLARWLSDGTVEFLGRVDHQLKVHGFRIEAGEVEAALEAHPSVRQAVVVAREDEPGDQRLVAYVVPRAEQSVDTGALRQGLLTRLPEHMVPSLLVVLEALPLTPNGKVDRKALPAPGGERATQGRTFVEPRTPAEQDAARVWAQVLGVDKVGVHDDFFSLGGHSLLTLRLSFQVRESLGVELPLRAVFDAPTLEQYARLLEQARNDSSRAAS